MSQPGEIADNKKTVKFQETKLHINPVKTTAKATGNVLSGHHNHCRFDAGVQMATNVAFYRNENCHRPADTVETQGTQ